MTISAGWKPISTRWERHSEHSAGVAERKSQPKRLFHVKETGRDDSPDEFWPSEDMLPHLLKRLRVRTLRMRKAMRIVEGVRGCRTILKYSWESALAPWFA
jgi:hypothetical protein